MPSPVLSTASIASAGPQQSGEDGHYDPILQMSELKLK